MKRFTVLFLIAALMCALIPASVAESSLEYSCIADMYDAVSPAIVELDSITWKWDAEKDVVSKTVVGSGSAVYVDERGYFMTNAHIVEEADELEILLSDGTTLEATLVGYDSAVDVAVVKISEEFDAEPVRIGSSSALRVGEQVCAIGTPFSTALYNTITTGIVSGLNRNDADSVSSRAVDLIQIDVAINPGNSGGALLNMKGEIVGIPFMKFMYTSYTTSDGQDISIYENLSFAVPIDAAWPIAKSLIETGAFNRPRFGVSVLDNNGPEEPLKNFPPAGLKIESVDKNGSGSKAGLRQGDVITHVNGTRIKTFREYTKIIDKLGEGESFEITVVRYNDAEGNALKKFETLTLTVTLEMID